MFFKYPQGDRLSYRLFVGWVKRSATQHIRVNFKPSNIDLVVGWVKRSATQHLEVSFKPLNIGLVKLSGALRYRDNTTAVLGEENPHPNLPPLPNKSPLTQNNAIILGKLYSKVHHEG